MISGGRGTELPASRRVRALVAGLAAAAVPALVGGPWLLAIGIGAGAAVGLLVWRVPEATTRRIFHAAFLGFFVLYAGVAVVWLLAGLAPAVAHAVPSLHDALHRIGDGGGLLAGLAGRVADASHSAVLAGGVTGARVQPGIEVPLEFFFSLTNLVLAVFLVWLRPRDRVARLLAVGMVGTAAVFNLQVHSALDVLRSPFFSFFHDSLFHVLAGVAYVYALLLFPDGRLPGWSLPAWVKWPLAVVYLFVLTMVGTFAADFHGTDAAGFLSFFGIVVPVAGLTSQAYRARRAPTAEQRQQSRVLAWVLMLALLAALLFQAATAALVAWGDVAQRTVDELTFRVIPPVITVVPVALFVVILRYRLWDIDRVIHKALLYGALAAFVTAVYVSIAVGLGAAIGSGGEPNLWLSMAATAIIAVAFQPVRARFQRLASRLVYGQRATPYEVMADFSKRMAGLLSVEEVLPRMAEAAARGVGAARSRVRLFLPDGAERSVLWPAAGDGDGFDRTLAVVHQGERVGEIAVAKPPGEPLTAAEEALLTDLASQAGLALHNVCLTAELEARLEEISVQAAELQASRQRIVAAQDAAARRLERDIHDGAQQQLIALAVRLRLLRDLIERDPGRALHAVDEASAQAQEALENLRDLARGIYPAILGDRGLAVALESQTRKLSEHVDLHVRGIERYALETEAAVYFCCLEALQNVAKYAGASHVEIRLAEEDGELMFSVTDDGCGFDPHTTPPGSGLQNMADRLAALGGKLEIRSRPGGGTTVTGRILVRARERVG